MVNEEFSFSCKNFDLPIRWKRFWWVDSWMYGFQSSMKNSSLNTEIWELLAKECYFIEPIRHLGRVCVKKRAQCRMCLVSGHEEHKVKRTVSQWESWRQMSGWKVGSQGEDGIMKVKTEMYFKKGRSDEICQMLRGGWDGIYWFWYFPVHIKYLG